MNIYEQYLERQGYYGMENQNNTLAHVGRSKRDGAKIGSGRYPLGSGKNGKKFGVGKYRNEDGSLTPAGQKRYDYEVRRNNSKSKKNRADEDSLRDPDKWVEDDISNRKQLVDSTRNFTRSVEELDYVTRRNKKAKRMDLSKMSDEEMRKKINRELLERQYNNVFNSAEVSTGRQHVRDILATTTATLGTISTGLSIALAIHQLKKG